MLLKLNEICMKKDQFPQEWALLKVLLNKYQLDSSASFETYPLEGLKCKSLVNSITKLKSISLSYSDIGNQRISLSPLNLLYQLKTIKFSGIPATQINLKVLNNPKIKELYLKDAEVKSLDFIKSLKLKRLSLPNNPLYSLSGIERQKSLVSLNVTGTPLRDLSPLSGIPLKELYAASINSLNLRGLEHLESTIEVLDLRNTMFMGSEIIDQFSHLKVVRLTGEIGKINLSMLKKIEYLELQNFRRGNIVWPKSLQNLKNLKAQNNKIINLDFLVDAENLQKLDLTLNRINNLSFFENYFFPDLKELDLSANPIVNVFPLHKLRSLIELDLSRTPIGSGIIPKLESNCPTLSGSPVLREFCLIK